MKKIITALTDYPAITEKFKMEDHGLYGPIELPFEFPFYGQKYNQVWILGNGAFLFGLDGVSTTSGVTALPPKIGLAPIGPAIAFLWEGMQPGACDADMALIATPEGFGVHWNNVHMSAALYRQNDFQGWIYPDGSAKGFYRKAYLNPLKDGILASNGVIGAIDHTKKRGVTFDVAPGWIENAVITWMPEAADFETHEPAEKPRLDAMTTTATTVVKGGAHKLVISRAALADVGQIVIDITE